MTRQPSDSPARPTTPAEATSALADGNARFVAGESAHPHADAAWRARTADQGQAPFATILACSDSRVPVELLFDAGVGDVFVIRVAGNVAATDEIGSIEYGVGHLATPVLVVLGHTHCGAVTSVASGVELHGCIPALVEPITRAVRAARDTRSDLEGEALVEAAVRENVWLTLADILRGSAAVRDRVRAGETDVLGAIYDLVSGEVEWLGTHPDQDALLA